MTIGPNCLKIMIRVFRDNDLLSITQPKIIKDIHLKYLNAGLDQVLRKENFNANSISEDYYLQDKSNENEFRICKKTREVG